MNQPAVPNLDRLQQLCTQRVMQRIRHVLQIWQRLAHDGWAPGTVNALHDASQQLLQDAERFELPTQAKLARTLCQYLQPLYEQAAPLDEPSTAQMRSLLERLAHASLRRGEQFEEVPLPDLPRPAYILLQDREQAEHLAQQLAFYGTAAHALADANAFREALTERAPALVVMDVDFTGAGQGIGLAEQVRDVCTEPVALLFYCVDESDTASRLAALRAGGQGFLTGTVEASSLLEKIEQLEHPAHNEPLRVLIIDDSRTQARYSERLLNAVGIDTRVLTEPLQAMETLADFQPDLLILDMYMPTCTGPELAKVIRHNERYVSLPIIYLSAEDDLDKQLDALSEGGDDFLTKPVRSRQLISTVRNRAARARHLQTRLVRDSLTGLYNHTHILQLLEDCSTRARRGEQPLSFAMLDLDHFKRVNDQHGHPMGDRVLKTLALFLRQRLRRSDCIGRYGGEEFAVVMPNTELDAAHGVLDEIRQRFADLHFPAQRQQLQCTFSAGVVMLTGDMDVMELASAADQALYAAKHGGRNRVEKADR
ncbi:GGDEF domain-containing response regulator [Pseudomonas cremoricolorata]|uniref:diguanylate cyclase n=1 Tax=Pseudomonas cremoricolorata TaxID=157783 RepID=A0A089WJ40_9PSED|nr:diguanylate cyclase [Pseudomonas cremoricolorata]AIR89330.1 diguanylate cyclase [Pseudomonas cremoricolorata]